MSIAVPSQMSADLAWLREQLARFTYRPGWTMRIEEGTSFTAPSYYRIRIKYTAPDSRNPENETVVEGIYPLPPYFADLRDETQFAEWLRYTLFEVERHESREWLRRDGQTYDDPHAQDGR